MAPSTREDDGAPSGCHGPQLSEAPAPLLVEERRVLAQVVPDDPELAEERCPPDVSSASVPYEVSHGVSVLNN